MIPSSQGSTYRARLTPMPRWLALAVFALVFLGAPRAARACSCAREPSALGELDRSAQVFQARVTRVRNTWADALPYGLVRRLPAVLRPELGVIVELEVTRVWKGPLNRGRSLLTGYGGGDCGLGAAVGDDWLIYAQSEDGRAFSNICTRSGHVSARATDLAELGPGKAPDPGRGIPRAVWLLAIGCAVFAAAAAIAVSRARG